MAHEEGDQHLEKHPKMSKPVPTAQEDDSVGVEVNSDKYVDDHGRRGQLSTNIG